MKINIIGKFTVAVALYFCVASVAFANSNNPAWCLGYSSQTAKMFQDKEAMETFDSIRPNVEAKFKKSESNSSAFPLYLLKEKQKQHKI